jgi:hypothetical protein
LCLHWSLVHKALHVPPDKEIQWCQVRRVRWPGYWASTSNPSVAKSCIQIFMDDISEVCQVTITLESYFTMDFQRHHFQQLR